MILHCFFGRNIVQSKYEGITNAGLHLFFFLKLEMHSVQRYGYQLFHAPPSKLFLDYFFSSSGLRRMESTSILSKPRRVLVSSP